MPSAGRLGAVVPARSPSRLACLATSLFVVTVAAGCARTVGPTMEEASLAFAVRTALVNDAHLGTAPIEVLVRGRLVTLRGTVASADLRERALTLTRAVPGISRVENALVVGASADGLPQRPRSSALPSSDPSPAGRHVGVGGSFQLARTRAEALNGHWSLAPSFRFGRGGGLRPAFDWFRLGADFHAGNGEKAGTLGFTALAGGLGYGTAGANWSLVASLTTGYTFTGFDIEPDFVVPADRAVPVEASGSWAILPTGTLWLEATRRVSVGVTGGYVFVWPHMTWLEDGRFVRRPIDAKTFVIGISIVYWVF